MGFSFGNFGSRLDAWLTTPPDWDDSDYDYETDTYDDREDWQKEQDYLDELADARREY